MTSTNNTSDLPKKKKTSTTIKPDIILTTPESLIITNLAAPGSIDSGLINFGTENRCTTVAPIRKISSNSLQFTPQSPPPQSPSPPFPTVYIAKQPSTSLNSIVEHHHHYHHQQQPSIQYHKSDTPQHFNHQNQSKATIDSESQTLDIDNITDQPPAPSTANNSRFHSLINNYNNKHRFSIAQTSETLVMLGIVLIFLIDFVQFYLALKVVNGEEGKIHRLEQFQYRLEENRHLQIGGQPQVFNVKIDPDIENKVIVTKSSDNDTRNGDEKDPSKFKSKLRLSKIHRSRALRVAIISLLALPLHLFGLMGVSKQSFSLTLTYSIISAVLLLLQLKSSANHRNMDNLNWVLWLTHLLFTLICIGYCFLLYHTKRNRIRLLTIFGGSLFRREPPTPTSPLSLQFSNS